MKQKVFAAALAAVLSAVAATPAAAANKEHQQLMADIRMLQEQSQLLQNLLGALNESIKAVNARLDQQTESNRKALADQKLVVDNLANDVRVIREKLDDNSVRVGSLTQEVEALRQALQQAARSTMSAAPDAAAPTDPTAAGAPPAPTAGTAPVPIGPSPQKMYDAANSDYMAGQYDLSVIGFQEFIKQFPRSELADDAQAAICSAYLNGHKDQQAVDACDTVIRTYPNTNSVPVAYYRKGLALANLKDLAGARDAWESLIKAFPDSNEAALARQGLERLKR